MHLLRPGDVGHGGPVIFVETRGIFQPLFIDVEDKALAARIQRQGAPRNGELSEVCAAYMESDGTVSVIRRQSGQTDDDSAAPAPKGPVK